jgi:8-amino-7-oxononanoate synthase
MFEQELSKLKEQHLLRRLTVLDSCEGPHITVQGRKLLLLCSNDYLGLASHPALSTAASAAMEQHGLGSGSSRLVSGTSRLHRELEQRIARFKGTEAALAFNSGYAANTGIIPAIAGPGDVVLSDSLNHASIIDGCRLSKAQVHIYRHADPDHLELLLKKSPLSRRRLIVSDGIFSMDGDLAPLPQLVYLAGKYSAILMVDDAHATGVLGRTGRGSTEHFGLSHGVPVQMGTLGKALGSFGAYVAGSRDLIDYLVNTSRSFMFSTSMPPAVCAAAIAAFDIIDGRPELRDRLWKNRERFVRGLLSHGITPGNSQSAIIPIMVGDSSRALMVSERLFERGIYASAIRPPTVPEGTARIRTTVMASHSDEDIDHAIDVFAKIKQEGCL